MVIDIHYNIWIICNNITVAIVEYWFTMYETSLVNNTNGYFSVLSFLDCLTMLCEVASLSGVNFRFTHDIINYPLFGVIEARDCSCSL